MLHGVSKKVSNNYIYKLKILSLQFPGCRTWSLTLIAHYEYKVSGNSAGEHTWI